MFPCVHEDLYMDTFCMEHVPWNMDHKCKMHPCFHVPMKETLEKEDIGGDFKSRIYYKFDFYRTTMIKN